MDFNTQRRIIKRLKEKGKSPLLFLPCLIAQLVVAVVFTVGRSIDMALSDKNGNFLGIKRKKMQSRSFEREQARLERRISSSKDDFTPKQLKRATAPLPYRPIWKRTVSMILSFCIAAMTVPAVGVSVAAETLERITVANTQEITRDSFTGYDAKNISVIDMSTNYPSDAPYAVNLASGAIRNMPSLTTVTLGYSDAVQIGGSNFANIAPAPTVIIKADKQEQYTELKNKLGSASQYAYWDDGHGYEFPADITGLTAYSGIDKVILKWDSVPQDTLCSVYTYNPSNGIYTPVPQSKITDLTSSGCTVAASSTETIYAVRASRLDQVGSVQQSIRSVGFTRSNSVSARKAGKPVITEAMSNNNIRLNISMPPKTDYPDYLVLYKNSGTASYDHFRTFTSADLTNGIYIAEDTFTGDPISYAAVAYYDPTGINGPSDIDMLIYTGKDEKTAEYTVINSNVKDINEALLNSPTNLRYDLNSSATQWTFKWSAPDNTSNMDISYTITIDGVVIKDNVSSLHFDLPTNSNFIKQGQDFVFGVTAASEGMTSGPAATVTVPVKSNSTELIYGGVGNGTITVKFRASTNPNAQYTIKLKESTASQYTSLQPITASDCTTTSDGYLSYTISGLKNDVVYDLCMSSSDLTYSSAVIQATPMNCPAAPSNIAISNVTENSAKITWDVVMVELDGKKVNADGYYITVKSQAGETKVPTTRIAGKNQYDLTDLINEEIYYAYLESYITVNGQEVRSETGSVSPQIKVNISMNDVTGFAAVADSDKAVISLSWSAVANATKYVLYRSYSGNPETIIYSGTDTSYTDNDILNRVDYQYYVLAVRELNGHVYQSKSLVRTSKIDVYVGAVQGLTATGQESSIALAWDKVDDADGYIVEYASATGSDWKQIADVSGTVYTHTGIENKTELKYRINAYKVVNGKRIFSSTQAMPTTGTAGTLFPAPLDFVVTTGEGETTLKWSAVDEAEGYEVYVVDGNGGEYKLDEVSKTTAIHKNIPNGTTIGYRVRAFKYVGNQRVYGDRSIDRFVTVGIYLDAPTDVTAVAADKTVTLKWKKSDGAEGYVVYSYDPSGLNFSPVGIVTSTGFTHTGLTNGRTYTYMIAGYKTVNGEIKYSGYSISVSAVPFGEGDAPLSDSNANTNDYRIFITGTTPYGMSNSNLISAFAEKGAFNSDIDVRFTLDGNDVTTVNDLLNFYGEGIESFLVYPMNISLYLSGTDTPVELNPGYFITLTIPVPDELLPYSQYISVMHVSDANRMEILPSTPVTVNGVECIQFTATDFSPYAFVVYLPDSGEDTSAGSFASAFGSTVYAQSAAPAFMCTSLKDIYRRRARNKVYRIRKNIK